MRRQDFEDLGRELRAFVKDGKLYFLPLRAIGTLFVVCSIVALALSMIGCACVMELEERTVRVIERLGKPDVREALKLFAVFALLVAVSVLVSYELMVS